MANDEEIKRLSHVLRNNPTHLRSLLFQLTSSPSPDSSKSQIAPLNTVSPPTYSFYFPQSASPPKLKFSPTGIAPMDTSPATSPSSTTLGTLSSPTNFIYNIVGSRESVNQNSLPKSQLCLEELEEEPTLNILLGGGSSNPSGEDSVGNSSGVGIHHVAVRGKKKRKRTQDTGVSQLLVQRRSGRVQNQSENGDKRAVAVTPRKVSSSTSTKQKKQSIRPAVKKVNQVVFEPVVALLDDSTTEEEKEDSDVEAGEALHPNLFSQTHFVDLPWNGTIPMEFETSKKSAVAVT